MGLTPNIQKVIKHCNLSCSEPLELMKYVVAGSTAQTAAYLIGIHRTVIRLFHKLREKMVLKQPHQSEQFCGKIELDESYFGGTRQGKRGQGASGKGVFWGLLK